jgi:hypothetical protein
LIGWEYTGKESGPDRSGILFKKDGRQETEDGCKIKASFGLPSMVSLSF